MKKLLLCLACILFCMPVLFAQSIKLQYMCGEPTVFYYKIRPFIKLVNTGTSAVDLADVTIRYYYTKEGYVEQKLNFDWSPISGTSGAFFDGYLELRFSSGTIAAGAETGGIQLRIEKTGGGYFEQSDDYSFDPSILAYIDYEKITAYLNGRLVWGVEPPPPPAPTPKPPADDDWLHAEGNQIKDQYGKVVRLTGINWFGFETEVNGFYNLDWVNWRFALETMTELGFNILRLPISAELILEWKNGQDPLVAHVNGQVNWDIDGITSLVFLDKVIDYCKTVGMKVFFDMHGIARSQNEAIWLDASGAQNLRTAWQWLVTRYKNDDTILGADLFNEPHGQPFGDNPAAAKWDGSADAHNWRKEAETTAALIHAINPNLLIFVEGIECYPQPGYTYASTDKYTYDYNWWGGNLRGVADYPVNLGTRQDKLVYSPHDYGPDIHKQPWFTVPFDSTTLYNDCWYPNWFYIVEQNIAPVLIGEWGGKLVNPDNKKWLQLLADFIAEKNLHSTFWCFNPNSGDTGGIMLDDWNTVDTAKYAIVEPTLWKSSTGKYIGLDHRVDLGLAGTGTNVGTYYGTVTATPTPTGTPTPTPTATPTLTPTLTPTGSFLPGDANGDGTVDIVDALLVARYSAGLLPAPGDPAPWDYNKDGIININDALLIARFSAGLLT